MGIEITKYGRWWLVSDPQGIVCLTVYKKGAIEIKRRLESQGVLTKSTAR